MYLQYCRAMKFQSPERPGFDPLLADCLFILGYALLYIGVLAILRGILILVNPELAGGIPFTDLARSFLVGLRFENFENEFLLAHAGGAFDLKLVGYFQKFHDGFVLELRDIHSNSVALGRFGLPGRFSSSCHSEVGWVAPDR